ncbi:transcriptional regulator [Betaproteobacteria bacterium]|nr:transcriptional regulator [Betaproteobacteria bacterium]
MPSDHDTLARRLSTILLKLNSGERLGADALAEEFAVSKRTILRDLQVRFAYLPLEKADGLYSLDPAYLGRITYADIQRFAGLAGLNGLFPGLDTQFIRELFDVRLQETLHVHGGSYEDHRQRLGDFRALQKAIGERRLVSFAYQKPEGGKKVTDAAPYRLVNHTGVWYLIATDQGQPKAYAFGKIGALSCAGERFTPDKTVADMIAREDSIWLNEKKTEAVLTVAPQVASYFKRRKLIAQQTLVKELEDGGLLISGKFAHPNQILPIVRHWLPHVRIVSPESWQEELEAGLKAYLEH